MSHIKANLIRVDRTPRVDPRIYVALGEHRPRQRWKVRGSGEGSEFETSLSNGVDDFVSSHMVVSSKVCSKFDALGICMSWCMVYI